MTGRRRHLWLVLLFAASAVFTLAFVCALPFAAFTAIAALTLPRRDALLLIVAVWVTNQILGFSVLHYPWDGMTFIWGAILGTVAIASAIAAKLALRGRGPVGAVFASFAAAFVVYEGGLYLVSAAAMGGTENFGLPIVLRILAINAASFAVLASASLAIAKAAGSPTAISLSSTGPATVAR